ncbi:MAG: formate dehydrogenase subunit gamma [Caulobacteraceae bacterium]
MTRFEPRRPERGEEIVAALAGMDGATVPILHALQAAFGHVPRDAVPIVAAALNLSRAEVFGTLSFYHDFRAAPPGRRMVKVCRAESCQAMGGEAAARFLLADLGVEWGETTADGAVTVEAVYCLGLCAVSPAALIDGEPLGRLDGMTLAKAARE